MEKVDPKIFGINPVLEFIRHLEVWEVARIDKHEWKIKTQIGLYMRTILNRELKKISVRTMEDHYLVKRIK